MNEHWRDEEIEAGLRRYAAAAPRPAAPASLRTFLTATTANEPRERVAAARPSSGRGSTLGAVFAALLVVAVVAAVAGNLRVRNAPVAATSSQSPRASQSVEPSPTAAPTTTPTGDSGLLPGPVVSFPAQIADKGATWQRLNFTVATVPNVGSILNTWVFQRANGIDFAMQIQTGRRVPVWISRNDTNWKLGGDIWSEKDVAAIWVASIVWTGSSYVAFGGVAPVADSTVLNPRQLDYEPALWTSSDGVAWRQAATPAGLPRDAFGNAVFGNGTYLVGIKGMVWRSRDLATWTRTEVPDAWLLTFLPGARAFVAADPYRVLRSTDGLTWAETSATGLTTMQVDANGLLGIAPGDAGDSVVRSSDGLHWTVVADVPARLSFCVPGLLWCSKDREDGGFWDFVYSPDGVHWTTIPLPVELASISGESGFVGLAGIPIVALDDTRTLAYYEIVVASR